MRVTSNLYPEMFKSQISSLKTQQLIYQTQVATGLRIQKASDDPLGFHQSQVIAGNNSQINMYLSSTAAARSLGTANYSAMTDLQRLITRASELAMRSNSPHTADEQEVIGEEMKSILDQVAEVANRKYDGRYLFGGTKNVPPVVQTSEGPPPTYEYNNEPALASPPNPPNTPDGAQPADYTSNITQSEIAENHVMDTGFVAGRTASGVDRPAFDGFLCDGTTDILATLQTMVNDLSAGNAVDTAELGAIKDATSLVAMFVGKAATRLEALDLNEASLEDQKNLGVERMDAATGVSLADAITELQRAQLQYQAALQSGSQVLTMSLLDYL